jgi:hypothetical protein
MARDLGDTIGSAVGRVGREAAQSLMSKARKSKNGPVPGLKGVAVGAGLAAAAPLAVKGASKLAKGGLGNGANPLHKPVQKAGEKVKGAASDVIDKKIQDAGGPGGIAKEAGKSLIPGLGGGGDDNGGGGKSGEPGVGKGRRMPIQQAVDVPVPVSTAYNQFTQFEEWPKFMHRVTSISQEDETNVSFKAKIWGVSKEFQAEIDEQRPDERIKWHVTQGLSHKGVATFHELADRLTRIEVNVDIEPGSLIEKFARGARHTKRAVRADLHRFKAYIMMNEEEAGAWRGTIEDAEVKSSKSSPSASDRSRPSDPTSDRARAASASSGRTESSPSGRSKSASGSKRSSSNSSSKRTTKRSSSSNGGDPSPTSPGRRKSGSRP